jgi:hypothetical protein
MDGCNILSSAMRHPFPHQGNSQQDTVPFGGTVHRIANTTLAFVRVALVSGLDENIQCIQHGSFLLQMLMSREMS